MTDLMYIKGNCFVLKLSAKIGESYYFYGSERVEKMDYRRVRYGKLSIF